ncbi:MAG TPA: hypothetical protein VGR10_08005, partial [Thermoleophilaceae bacterium]|nr:hypothetical protein [Thermoleophilaceae bacterium]
MSEPTEPRMRWWGWGVDGHDRPLPPAAEAMLRREIGMGGSRHPPVTLEEVRLPESGLPGGARRRIEDLVGQRYVRDDRHVRVAHALGKSYPDLVRIRAGDGSGAPDAIAFPGPAEEGPGEQAACAYRPLRALEAEDGEARVPLPSCP